LINTSKIVAFATDEKYAPYAGVAIQSLCEHIQGDIRIVILEDNISDSCKKKIAYIVNNFPGVTLEWVSAEIEKYFGNFRPAGEITLSMYSRFRLPSLYPSEKRLLYMDCDTVVLGDISKLFEETLCFDIIAAVPTMPNDGGRDARRRLDLSMQHKYFNSGILLLDCQKWQQKGIYDKLMLLEKEYRDRLIFCDQDLLNKCFDGNRYKVLSPIYNATNNDITDELHQKAVIRHFEGGVKPWKQHPLKIWAKRYKAKYRGLWEFWKVAIRSPFKDELFAKYPLERWIMEKLM